MVRNQRMIEKRGHKTQSEIANAIGITTAYYSMIENGKRIPPYRIMKLISDYFNVKQDYFFYYKV